MGYLTDAVAEMRDHGFTDTLEARLIADLNNAMWRVCAKEPWNFLETTTTVSLVLGDSEVPTITDLSKVTSFVIPTVGRVRPERRETIVQSYFDSLTSTGAPRRYYFIGDELHVYPPPNSAYSAIIDYIKAPAAMVLTTNEDPPVPERHRHVLTARALIDAYNRDDDAEQGATYQSQYEEAYADMREDCLRSHYDEPDRILMSWDEGDEDY